MPGVDLLDAFAELVVCVVFNLPRDEPQRPPPSSGEDDNDDSAGCPAGANSSGTTQIFSRVNSMEDSEPQAPLPLSPTMCEAAAATATATTTTVAAKSGICGSQLGSTQSLDMYPVGMWNAVPGVTSPHTAAANSHSSSSNHSSSSRPPQQQQHQQQHPSSRPSSVVSLNTGDVSTPRSSGPTTDRSAGFWNRVLGSSGAIHTPPRNASYGQFPNTGVTTNASSFVQLTEEDLGMMNASGRQGGMSGWTGFSTPPSLAQVGGAASQQQLCDWNGGDSRGPPTPSNASTPLYEGSAAASATQLPPLPSSWSSPQQLQQQQQQLQSLRLNPHGLYIAARRSNSPQEGQSQASSSSEFVVL